MLHRDRCQKLVDRETVPIRGDELDHHVCGTQPDIQQFSVSLDSGRSQGIEHTLPDDHGKLVGNRRLDSGCVLFVPQQVFLKTLNKTIFFMSVFTYHLETRRFFFDTIYIGAVMTSAGECLDA